MSLDRSKKIKELNYLLHIKSIDGKTFEHHRNILKAKWVLTIVRPVSDARQICGMIEKANDAISTCPTGIF